MVALPKNKQTEVVFSHFESESAEHFARSACFTISFKSQVEVDCVIYCPPDAGHGKVGGQCSKTSDCTNATNTECSDNICVCTSTYKFNTADNSCKSVYAVSNPSCFLQINCTEGAPVRL